MYDILSAERDLKQQEEKLQKNTTTPTLAEYTKQMAGHAIDIYVCVWW